MFSGKKEVHIELAERYELYIKKGVIGIGERLPSVRSLASELALNPSTVQKAYAVLEEKGLIRCIPKKGVFVFSDSYQKNGDAIIPSPAILALMELRERGFKKSEIENAIKEVFSDD